MIFRDRDIVGYEDYTISRSGIVTSKATGKEISTRINKKNGYIILTLYNRHKDKYDTVYLHRILAQTYIPNPNNLPMVNHKDTDKLYTVVSNLEWCTASYNTKHAHDNGLIKQNTRRVGIVENGIIIREFDSISEASRITGAKHIVDSCNNKYGRQTSGGYKWRYLDNDI